MHPRHACLAASLAFLALAAAPPAAGAQERDSTTTVCKDGTTDQGAAGCGRHGGVDSAATTATRDGARDARRPPRTGATIVICRDGTSSTAGNYACDLHGGVKSTPGQVGEVRAALRMEAHRSTVPRGQAAQPKPGPGLAGATADTVHRATKPDTSRASRP